MLLLKKGQPNAIASLPIAEPRLLIPDHTNFHDIQKFNLLHCPVNPDPE
jgi:hypothetical protein